MFGLPNPWIILGAIVVCISAYFYGHHEGFVKRNQEMQAEIAVKNEQSRQAEQKLNEQLNQTSTQLKEANDVVAKKQSDLSKLISAGRVRLPTSTSCVQTNASATSSSGSISDASESDRETLQLIAQLAAEGDQAINRLNACIAAYNQVREQVNGQR